MNIYRHYGLAHRICTEAINIFYTRNSEQNQNC